MGRNRGRAALVAAVLVMAAGVAGLAACQTGNPAEAEKPVRYMFVQIASSGAFAPAGDSGIYLLTLKGVYPYTIAFSDRPERVVRQVPMAAFLKGMGFSESNPPNAAVVVEGAPEDEDVCVVELFDPVYNPEDATLTYKLRILEKPNHSYAEFNERNDGVLPPSFGAVSLFIDDCPDLTVCCDSEAGPCGAHPCKFRVGSCWHWLCLCCTPCHGVNCAAKCGQEKSVECECGGTP